MTLSGWDQSHDIESLEDDLRWRRADLGDLPERGQIVTLVRFPSDRRDTTMKVWERMRVEVILTKPSVRIMGPGLPFVDELPLELPARPEDEPGGTEYILWRERA